MVTIAFGILLFLHGLVHLLYAGHSIRLFELKPGMDWPDNCHIFRKILPVRLIRMLASVFVFFTAIGFIVSTVLYFMGHELLMDFVISTVAFSTFTYILFWDGTIRKLPDQGLVGILVNILIFVVVYYFDWHV